MPTEPRSGRGREYCGLGLGLGLGLGVGNGAFNFSAAQVEDLVVGTRKSKGT